MIFVSVGTSKYPFPRLVRTVDELAPELDERILLQAGSTLQEYTPRNVEYVEYLSREEYEEQIAASDLFVTHAGTGSIITALRSQSPVVLFPRKPEHGEHGDGQQIETADGWQNRAGVRVARTTDELGEILRGAEVETPTYGGPEEWLGETIADILDRKASKRGTESLTVFCPTPPGGHLTQLLALTDGLGSHDVRYLTWNSTLTGAVDAVELVEGYYTEELPDLGTVSDLLVTSAQAARLVLTHRPSVVLSTGGGVFVIYVACLAKLLGADVIHVESMTRFHSSSTTGRILYPIADRFFTQHRRALSEYGDKAEYRGAVM
jgi:UDP-N-acetylglucosamine transferase subunit ALG13